LDHLLRRPGAAEGHENPAPISAVRRHSPDAVNAGRKGGRGKEEDGRWRMEDGEWRDDVPLPSVILSACEASRPCERLRSVAALRMTTQRDTLFVHPPSSTLHPRFPYGCGVSTTF